MSSFYGSTGKGGGGGGDPAFEFENYKIELERRLRHALSHIDTTQIVLGLSSNRLVGTSASGTFESVSNLTSWIAGTTNQVVVTNDGDGTVTLSTPQDIDTLAVPLFAGVKFKDITDVGKLSWNDADRCLDLVLDQYVTASISQEMYMPRVVNKTGSTITNGSVVYIVGAQGSRPTIALADADTYATSYKAIGVATEDIANDAEGFVTTHGLVRDINTNSWAEGDCLYLSSTAGGLTNIAPADGKLRIFVGMVIYAHANQGIICINVNQDKYMFGDIDNGNYSLFEADGTLKFNGDATTWQDIDFSIIIRTTGPNIPILTTLQGNITAPQWEVNDFNVCEGQEFVHAWKEASRVYWHIHMATNGLDATDRFVKWEVEYFWVNVDGQISATNTQSYEYTIPANTPSKTMKIVSIYNWIPTAGKIGGHVYARLRRIASTGTAPTSNPWCTMLQLHIECDTTGSRLLQTK